MRRPMPASVGTFPLRLLASAVLVAAAAACGAETSVVLSFAGSAVSAGDSLCVAVSADGTAQYSQRFELAQHPLPATLTVAAGGAHRLGFEITAAIQRRGRD